VRCCFFWNSNWYSNSFMTRLIAGAGLLELVVGLCCESFMRISRHIGIRGAIYDMLISAERSTATAIHGPQLWRGVESPLSECECSRSWVAVYTKQHHEKKVADYLADQAFECYLPLYTSERRWSNHRRATIQMPLFPTYLFVRSSSRMRARILRTPGVFGIVGRGANDELVSDQEIEILRNGLHLRQPEPHDFAVGESVRIAAGPLAGIQGTIVRWNSSFRVVIRAPMIGQSVSVEVAAAELEPLSLDGAAPGMQARMTVARY